MKDEYWFYVALFFFTLAVGILLFAWLRDRLEAKREEEKRLKKLRESENGRVRRLDDPDRRDPMPSPTE